MRHIWFDPGQTTGWALFEDDTPTEMGTLFYPTDLYSQLVPMIEFVDIVGFENYRIRPKKMKSGYNPVMSTPVAILVIGAIELASFLTNPDRILVSQEPDVKPAGYGYAGLTYVAGKKGTHMQDAVAHGAWWWMERGQHLART